MPAKTIRSNVHFHFLKGGNSLSNRTSLKSFIAAIFKKEGKKIEDIHYVFCSDDYLLEINRQYLQHDYYTDIITFGLSDPGQPINAEIYISVDRVRDNSLQFNATFRKELHRVIFHGALHLCGYKDKKKEEVTLMRKKEQFYLDSYYR